MQRSLKALATARRITKIITVGAAEQHVDEERALLASLPLAEGFEQRGSGSEEEISTVLATCSYGIFAQDELSFGKSGTFMAYAAHGLNVLADFASPSKPEPVCWLVAPDELLAGLSDEELQSRAKQLRIWQEQNCSWEVIARKLGDALGLDGKR